MLQLIDPHGDVMTDLPIADGQNAADWTGLRHSAAAEYGKPHRPDHRHHPRHHRTAPAADAGTGGWSASSLRRTGASRSCSSSAVSDGRASCFQSTIPISDQRGNKNLRFPDGTVELFLLT
jgi:hypothetical protein